jgi:hypothetical protein
MSHHRAKISTAIFGACGLCVAASLFGLAQTTATSQDGNNRLFDPGHGHSLSTEDGQIRASIEPAPYPYILKIKPLTGGQQEREIPLPYELAQIDELCLWKNKIVVRGMLNNALGGFVIFDKFTGQQIDEVRAYWPNISLKSGFILFTKEYPIHFAEGTEDHYMLYRLDAPPASNHAPGTTPIQTLPAGIPLYPLTIGNQNFDNVNLQREVHEQDAAGFFWNEQGTEAITLDSFDGKYTLVLMQFSSAEAVIRILGIDPNSMCGDGNTQTCPKRLYLEKATFSNDKNRAELVTIVFGHPQGVRAFEKVYSVTDFAIAGRRSLERPQWNP